MPTASALPAATAALAGMALVAVPVAAAEFRLPLLSCTQGPNAYVLPRHYPTLHNIGRHTFVNLQVRTNGATTLTRRRIDYTGMRLEAMLHSARPHEYEMAALEVWSRRWNIGPLSVGREPRRTINDKAMAAWPKDGVVDLQGPVDSIRLELQGGRIDRVVYRCGARAAP